jgi:hypothetical protein
VSERVEATTNGRRRVGTRLHRHRHREGAIGAMAQLYSVGGVQQCWPHIMHNCRPVIEPLAVAASCQGEKVRVPAAQDRFLWQGDQDTRTNGRRHSRRASSIFEAERSQLACKPSDIHIHVSVFHPFCRNVVTVKGTLCHRQIGVTASHGEQNLGERQRGI